MSDSEDGSPTPHTAPSAEDTLRLLEAFFGIADPQSQAAVVALAEQHAVSSPMFARALAKMLRKH
jgi:hypothetical protein